MTALQNAFALFGMLAIAYNAANALHETGHVIGVSVGGGAASHIALNPFFWSRTYYSSNPSPMLAAWGGPIGGVVLGLAPAGILVLLGYQVPRLLAVLAVVSLGVNGVYLTAGVAGNTGDGADLVRLGVPKSAVLSLGISLMVLAGASATAVQPKLGVALDAPVIDRSLVLVGGIGLYLLAMLAYVAAFHRSGLAEARLFVGAGFLLVGVIVIAATALGDSAARLLPKAAPVATGRSEMLAYVGAGVVVVLAEIAVFGR